MSGMHSAVQQRVSAIVPHAIYVHCCAHRLNLCLVNTIQNIPLLVNFFDTVQSLYKFLMNSQNRYKLFIKTQKKAELQKKYAILHLERLIETRWSYWYTSLQKLNMGYDVILEVLNTHSKQGDQTARAFGLLQEVSTFKFIIILKIMETVLMKVHSLSCELQSPTLILPSAIKLCSYIRYMVI